MSIWLYLLLVLPVILGTAISFLLLPSVKRGAILPKWILTLGLGWGLGLGLWSVSSYLSLRFNFLSAWFVMFEVVLSLLLMVYCAYLIIAKRFIHYVPKTEVFARNNFTKFDWALSFLFAISILIAAGLQILHAINNPHGNWDAWAFWNLRASFFLKNYPEWMSAFDTESLNFNLDYPLLIPCLVFRMWQIIGYDSAVIPAGIGIGFTIASVMVILGGLWLLTGLTQGLVASICLLSTKMFLVCGADQYSDVPLAYYFLCAVVVTSISVTKRQNQKLPLVLAGMFLGLALWTKNEGQLLTMCFLTGFFLFPVLRFKDISFGSAVWTIAGMIPFSAILLDFKINVTPMVNAYISVDYWPRIWAQILNPERYKIIAHRFLVELFTFHRWGFVSLFLPFYWWSKGFTEHDHFKSIFKMSVLTMMLILMGYFFIYVITPSKLQFHLDTALNRLFIHIFPVILFVFFLGANPPFRDSNEKRMP